MLLARIAVPRITRHAITALALALAANEELSTRFVLDRDIPNVPLLDLLIIVFVRNTYATAEREREREREMQVHGS